MVGINSLISSPTPRDGCWPLGCSYTAKIKIPNLWCMTSDWCLKCSLWFTVLIKRWSVRPVSLNGNNTSFAKHQRSAQCHPSVYINTSSVPRGRFTFSAAFFSAALQISCDLAELKLLVITRNTAFFEIFTVHSSRSLFLWPTAVAWYRC